MRRFVSSVRVFVKMRFETEEKAVGKVGRVFERRRERSWVVR